MSKLILLGGPPGVGKTSVLKLLPQFYQTCAVFDADDIWRTYPQDKNVENRSRNIVAVQSVLKCHLESAHAPLFVAWVFANPALVEDVLNGIDQYTSSIQKIYLVASPKVLQERLALRFANKALVQYSLSKLRSINELNHPKINTTNLEPDEIAREIVRLVTA
ncbi:MAG: AAA family ATPase [Pseudomonadales bacterium]|nr:AAA family ATPase [Pseudomonadales bacterium]